MAILLVGMTLAFQAKSADPANSQTPLPEAVRQAIASNLDLAAQHRALAAARQEIGLARSPLLPQVDIGARAQILEDDRSDSAEGKIEEKSVAVGAGLSQVLYDEASWAGFEIEKYIYDGRVQQLESFRLAVVQDAAEAFLELDRTQRVLVIQQGNREVTRQNLETSRSRIAAGWSSERELLRWESQLAGNDTDVRKAQVFVLQNRFELNRVRSLPPESAVSPVPATIGDLGFVYAHDEIAEAIAEPDTDRQMRDFMVRRGLRRSPDLAALDASIAAAERQLTSNRRAFWVPTLTLGAGVDHLEGRSEGKNFNDTTWDVTSELTFPLFRGGAKFVEAEQVREILSSLRVQRRAVAESVEQAIRAAFAQASGAFESVDFAKRQAAAARRNFELVDSSYTLGVASILDLLDAQSQLLAAELSLANAVSGFLEDTVTAERAMSFYAFLEPPSEVATLLDQLSQKLGRKP